MKLLFDENLSPRLPELFASVFEGLKHVHECGLGAAEDGAIWQFAAENAFVLVSKDLDFHDRSLVDLNAPKLIWLRTGNCSTSHVEQLIRNFAREIAHFANQPNETLLVLP